VFSLAAASGDKQTQGYPAKIADEMTARDVAAAQRQHRHGWA
jgi:hypothetical protein